MIRGRFLTSKDDISQVIALRRKVFCEEQGYSIETEPDGFDAMAVYALAFDEDGTPVATGRLYIDDDKFHIGRVCVLKEMRGMHVGDFVVRMLLYRAQDLNATSIYLCAQEACVDFYRRYGFETFGDVVYDEGQPHYMMVASAGNINIAGSCGGHSSAPAGSCNGDCANCTLGKSAECGE